MNHTNRSKSERQNGDVVLLAEVLRGGCQGGAVGAGAQQFSDSVEAEELAAGVLRLGDAVGHQHQGIALGEREMQGGEVAARRLRRGAERLRRRVPCR